MIRNLLILTVLTFGSAILAFSQSAVRADKTGILLLAHGGSKGWNEEVSKLSATINKTDLVEVAFGMATKRNIQTAIDTLAARGATRIVAVPLFVSSNSSVITSTEYLLGLRNEAPKDLAMFAKMDHGSGSGSGGHDSHATTFDPTTPIKSKLPIRMAPALNDHSILSEILLARARSISSTPEQEVVVLVAHGPVSDETNKAWLVDMASLASQIKPKSTFHRIEYLTVRDDAPEPIRSQATEEFRSVVKRALDENRKVLIIPVLISYGGIEAGVKKRLEGLTYFIPSQGILPDDRLVDWVLQSARE